MNKIEIEIPAGKEIDWEASAKQKKVVLKDKQMTYEDICEKLFNKGHYFIDTNGKIRYLSFVGFDDNSASTQHQLECILAKNKVANVARYLNDEWESYENDHTSVHKYIIWYNLRMDTLVIEASHDYTQYTGNIIFKSEELAKQAIEILGEDLVKLALKPLY